MKHKPPAKVVSDGLVFTLHISLVGSKPLIWRRIEILGTNMLGELHRVIQGVMNWEEAHLHQFTFGESKRPGREELLKWEKKGSESIAELWEERHYSDPLQELEDTGDEWATTIAEAARTANSRFMYRYDFGDGWDHAICVKQIAPIQPGADYPRCTAGKRRAPREDSGAICGWEVKVKIVNDPAHKEYKDIRRWMGLRKGETFDADWFDLGETNARMIKIITFCERARKAWLKELKRR